MIGEAAAAGRPVLVFEPTGGHPKIAALVAALEREGVVHRFCGRLEGEAYEPIDSTPIIADAIRQGWLRHRAALEFTRA